MIRKLFTKELTQGERYALYTTGAALALLAVIKIGGAIAEHYRTRPPALVNECTAHETHVVPVTRFNSEGKSYVTTKTRTTCIATRKVCRAAGKDYPGPLTCGKLWEDYNARGNPDA